MAAYLDQMPDLIVVPVPHMMVVTDFRGDTLFEPLPSFHTGTHRLNGILVMAGPSIQAGVQLEGAAIADLLPTVLYLLGLPVPAGIDGQVLAAAFPQEFLTKYPVRYQDSDALAMPSTDGKVYSTEDAQEIEDRLRGLGYLD